MKQSLYLTIAILVIGLVPGLVKQVRLSSLRDEHTKLLSEAEALGIKDFSENGASGLRSTKRDRGDMEERVGRVGSSLIAFARELESMESSGIEPDAEFQERAMKVMLDLTDLDADQIKRVIDKLKNQPDLAEKSRGDIISYAILTIADEHPQAAISMYVESSELLDKSLLGPHIIASALGRWAAASPTEAMDWIKKNQTKYPELVDDDAKRSVLSGIAVNDPVLAFDMLDEVGFDSSQMGIHSIIATGSTDPQQRTLTLNALRGYLAGISDPAVREETGAEAIELLARSIDQEGFESLTEWMNQAKLSATEKGHFASGMTYFTTKAETGKWVEWMGANLPADQVIGPVKDLVSEWTAQDYRSTGKWLGTISEGPARAAAVEAYAGVVAEYDPQVAAQWAMTLPPGPARDDTFRAVHENWPATDPDGAAAFAREHGIE